MASNRKKPQPSDRKAQFVALSAGERATSYDVARLAGVSQSAVSRCFKAGSSVSPVMRKRVMDAALQLEYQPNAIARGLITRRSNLVAVLISGRVNLYYPEVLFALTGQLASEGLRALMFTIDSEEDAAVMLDQVGQYQVDGVISASHLSYAQFEHLARRRIPVVFFNRYFDDHPVNTVFCDPSSEVDALIQRLVDLGHRRFGLIQGPASNMVSLLRARMVQSSLKSRGLTLAAEERGDFTYESGREAFRSLAGCTPGVTALVCVNDMMALGAMDEARTGFSLRVPKDISITGFDGIGTSRFAGYQLTTIRQPIGRMSEAAVGLLKAMVEKPGREIERRVFDGALIDGATLAPPPG
jgi:DNA-binding LacI/PurR family transcriptional regulator